MYCQQIKKEKIAVIFFISIRGARWNKWWEKEVVWHLGEREGWKGSKLEKMVCNKFIEMEVRDNGTEHHGVATNRAEFKRVAIDREIKSLLPFFSHTEVFKNIQHNST